MRLIKTFLNELKNYINSENYILHYPSLKIVPNEVNLHWYHSELEKKKDFACNNLGDCLSPYIVNWILKKVGIKQTLRKTSNLYAVGSILLMGNQNATIWGTGLPYMPNKLKSFFHNSGKRTLDVRCVRGPKTRLALIEMGHKCPPLFGDPACLLPFIYNIRSEKKYKLTFIPHYSKIIAARKNFPNLNVLDMRTNDVEYVVSEICASEKIISSSLHGIIIAESYGVPAVFLQDREDALNFKYEDWYESTCRDVYPIAHNFDEACRIKSEVPSNIKDLQKTLIDTFPIDLYENNKLPEIKRAMFDLLD